MPCVRGRVSGGGDISDCSWVIRSSSLLGTLSTSSLEQASAILDSIENQLRWPQAPETLMPALDLSARQWATNVTDDKRVDYDRQPKGLQPVWG